MAKSTLYQDWKQDGFSGTAATGFEDLNPLELPWQNVVDFKELPKGVELAKRSKSRLVLRIEHNGTALFVKRIFARKFKNQVSALVLGSKANREWKAAQAFLDKGVLVPKPVFVASDGKRLSFLATIALEEKWKPLDEFLRHHALSDELIVHLATFTAELHQKKLYHDDYRSDHLYLTEDWASQPLFESIILMDLDGATWTKTPSTEKRVEAVEELFLSLMRIDLIPKQAKLFCNAYANKTAIKLPAQDIYDRMYADYKKSMAEKHAKRVGP